MTAPDDADETDRTVLEKMWGGADVGSVTICQVSQRRQWAALLVTSMKHGAAEIVVCEWSKVLFPPSWGEGG